MMYVLVILSLSAGAQPGNSVDFFSKEACQTAIVEIRKAQPVNGYCVAKGNPLDMNSDEIRKLLRPKS